MCENTKEYHPLLCDSCTEEELYPGLSPRLRPVCRGRAKPSVKGAAAIITKWPEHCCSALSYWWLGLIVIMLTTFILYNSILAFALVPEGLDLKPFGPTDLTIDYWNSINTPYIRLPEVYLHFMTNSSNEFDVSKYIPHIEKFAQRHLDFNFNVVIVYNDTFDLPNEMSEEENNEVALNSLWSKGTIDQRKYGLKSNLRIRTVTLTKYLELSPMSKDWRRIPANIIEFYLKIVSIWDIGGLAVNPDILVPRSAQSAYFEKFQSLLIKYKNKNPNDPSEQKITKNVNNQKQKDRKPKKKVNNIRDVIENLEHEYNNQFSSENLTEAESLIYNSRKMLSKIIMTPKNVTEFDKYNKSKALRYNYKSNKETTPVETRGDEYFNENKNMSSILSTKDAALNNPKLQEVEDIKDYVRHRKHVNHQGKLKRSPVFQIFPNEASAAYRKSDNDSEKNLTMNEKYDKDDTKKITNETEDQLTLDLRGYIIATHTPCHAFISSLFTNALHHTQEETLQDFIITELSLFCKGILSSCKGIELILL